MIRNLRVRDFQSHRDSSLDFCPTLNAIVGSSDSGKSALLRALFWVWSGRPSGTSFIRNAAGEKTKRGRQKVGTAIVDIDVTDSPHISRIRNEDDNICTLGETTFAKLGRDTPAEVLAALRLQPINIQRQLDPPFLLLDSPGAIAAVFNKHTNLERVDDAIAGVNTQLRAATQKAAFAKDALAQVTEQLTALAWIEQEYAPLVADLAELESLQAQLEHKHQELIAQRAQSITIQQQLAEGESRYTELFTYRMSCTQLSAQLDKLHDKEAPIASQYATLVAMRDKLCNLQNMLALNAEMAAPEDALHKLLLKSLPLEVAVDELTSALASVKYCAHTLDAQQLAIANANKARSLYTQELEAREKADALRSELAIQVSQYESLLSLLSRYVELHDAVSTGVDALALLQMTLQQRKADMAAIDVCPYCMQPLNSDEARQHLLQECT